MQTPNYGASTQPLALDAGCLLGCTSLSQNTAHTTVFSNFLVLLWTERNKVDLFLTVFDEMRQKMLQGIFAVKNLSVKTKVPTTVLQLAKGFGHC